ncbi:unnamed protein product [Peronospora belbahrii]|uniref:Uncharacterized protein n=1 Tax=Peronospora belbahrii TaxID=622444 RepID=A0AAU9KM96_9STRA|nr:unnamed protein product [Peronospora belbahrii]
MASRCTQQQTVFDDVLRPGCVPHNNVLRKADTSMHDPYRERIPEPGRHSSFILNHIVSRPKKTVFNRSVTNATMMSTASASAPSITSSLSATASAYAWSDREKLHGDLNDPHALLKATLRSLLFDSIFSPYECCADWGAVITTVLAAGQPAHDDVDGLPSSEQEVSSGTSLRWESVRYSGASNTVADRNFLGQVSASRYRGQPIPCFLMRQVRPPRLGITCVEWVILFPNKNNMILKEEGRKTS